MFCSLIPQDVQVHKDPSDVYKAVSLLAFSLSILCMPVFFLLISIQPILSSTHLLSSIFIFIFRCKFVYLCLQMLPLIFERLEKKLQTKIMELEFQEGSGNTGVLATWVLLLSPTNVVAQNRVTKENMLSPDFHFREDLLGRLKLLIGDMQLKAEVQTPLSRKVSII